MSYSRLVDSIRHHCIYNCLSCLRKFHVIVVLDVSALVLIALNVIARDVVGTLLDL